MIEKLVLQKRIGQRVIALRKEKGISQAELARLCDKDKQAIEKIERGKHNPTINTLYLIAQALDIKLKNILDGVDEDMLQ